MKTRTFLISALFLALGCSDAVTEDKRESAPQACEAGQTCPIGSSCNGTYCIAETPVENAPQVCDETNACSTGFECIDTSCVYSFADRDCTTSNESEVCGTGFCVFAQEDACGIGGEIGSCVAPTEALSIEENTVCGCDGNSYWNPDFANDAGVSIQYSGPCGDPEE